MKWRKVTLQTTTEAVDLVSNLLEELGIEGIEIEDYVPLSEEDKKKLFIDILPELPPDDGSARVNFYLDMDREAEPLLEQVREGLKELSDFVEVGSGEITVSETEDKDWMNNWKEFFKPFRVDDTIVIKPTWEELPEKKADDIVIEIDPGTAFGTGAHETTKLCIKNLKKYLKNGDMVLDVGCGSGILSIVSLLLGASYAAAVDIDENAAAVSVENAQVNHIPAVLREKGSTAPFAKKNGMIEVAAGNVLEDEKLRSLLGAECYDVVVANILADVIIPLAEVVGECMKPGAVFISSGIICTKRDAVEEALRKNGFSIVEAVTMGDWVSFVAKK